MWRSGPKHNYQYRILLWSVEAAWLIVVLLWMGGLKAFRYEADGIVPFVANSPFMNHFYSDGENYKAHKNPELA